MNRMRPDASAPRENGRFVPDCTDEIITRRPLSLFEVDVKEQQERIEGTVRGSRMLIVGGGGSIGGVTTGLLAGYGPAALHVVDQSENYLAELVRDLRGRPAGLDPAIDFRALPIDYGSPIMERLLRDAPPYDAVLNFAAMKHVRSEKDLYSVLQMLDTNLVKHVRFKQWLARHGHDARYFAVSTDKAANPTSLMGASKRLMEDLVFNVAGAASRSITSARFANVTFSNGSLLQGFRHRIERVQPLAVPRDTRRYFVSHQEAGDLCILATFAAPSQHIVFPNMDPRTELQALDDIAVRVLKAYGYDPVFFDDEGDARRSVRDLARRGAWPIVLTSLDTSGEKPYEEFVGHGERRVDIGLNALSAVRHAPSRSLTQGLFDRISVLVNEPTSAIDKDDLVLAIKEVLVNFDHRESGKNLDQRF